MTIPQMTAGAVAEETASPRPAGPVRFFAALPWPVWVVAALVALLHLSPYLRAQLDTPDDWTVTGNLTISPDFMQYRVWMRQSLEEGAIVSNRFTTEPNRAYLPVPFYYAIGRLAAATGVAPEWAFVWAGTLFAFLLPLLLFATTRYFLRERVATWTAFLAIVLGGGVGGYILQIRQSAWAAEIAPIRMLLIDPFTQYTALIDELRGDYVVLTIFDAHFLLIWLAAVVAIMAFYRTVRSFSWAWLALTSVCFAVATVAHVYEGVTLLAIAASVTLLLWIRRINRSAALLTTTACTIAVGIVFAWIASLVAAAGLPMPPWRGIPVHPTLLFLGFPLAWVLLVAGLSRYWRSGGINEVFLLGWILGCTLLTLSAPFYPWPNRGVLSLQIPLTIVAAAIWFGAGRKLDGRALAVCILLMGSTPVMKFVDRWQTSAFNANEPHKFLGPQHRATIASLTGASDTSDVLMAGFRDRLWLAPEYRGRHYAGHFFLTVDYDRKQAEVEAFYQSDAQAQAAFLRAHGIRFLYVNKRQDPNRFRAVTGLVPMYESPDGTLFEYLPARRQGES